MVSRGNVGKALPRSGPAALLPGRGTIHREDLERRARCGNRPEPPNHRDFESLLGGHAQTPHCVGRRFCRADNAKSKFLSLMGLPDPNDVAAYEVSLAKITVGGAQPQTGRIEIREYDPTWPDLYAREAERIRAALGNRVVRLQHGGSTSVPGLPAKPIVDILLEVPDSSDEPAYAPDLEAAGYVLRIREPDWFEHRLFKVPDGNVHLHVFSAGCAETDRMVLFRDWLRSNNSDRDL